MSQDESEYLSVTDDCGRPRNRFWRFKNKLRVDPKGEDVVKVVDDARDERDGRDDQDDKPKYPPGLALSQCQVVEAVGRCPKVETCY